MLLNGTVSMWPPRENVIVHLTPKDETCLGYFVPVPLANPLI
jgi:hypothetical protein